MTKNIQNLMKRIAQNFTVAVVAATNLFSCILLQRWSRARH